MAKQALVQYFDPRTLDKPHFGQSPLELGSREPAGGLGYLDRADSADKPYRRGSERRSTCLS